MRSEKGEDLKGRKGLPDPKIKREMTIGQKDLGLDADKFLFVVVSRQTKKPFFLCVLCVLCVSAVKSPNPHLRNSA